MQVRNCGVWQRLPWSLARASTRPLLHRTYADAASRTIVLLPHEGIHNLHDAAPGTADFFTSKGNGLPLKFLRERCAAILEANPWLAARVVSQPQLSLVVPEAPSAADHCAFYEETSTTELGHTTLRKFFDAAQAPTPISAHGASLFSRRGVDCLDADEPLFKMRAVIAADGKSLLLSTSMSHVLGDGATLYRVHGMLHPDASVTVMSAERKQSFLAAMGRLEGAIPGTTLIPAATLHAPAFALSPSSVDKWAALHASGACRSVEEGGLVAPLPPATGACNVYLDDGAIAQAKTDAVAEGGVPFVSTNDVFTSWMFLAHRADLAVMAYNTRSLLGAEAQHLAGNYQVSLAFSPGEFSPASIRRAVALPGIKSEGVARGVPGPSQRTVLVTSWAQGHTQLELDGVTHDLHQPFVPAAARGAVSPFHAKAKSMPRQNPCQDKIHATQKKKRTKFCKPIGMDFVQNFVQAHLAIAWPSRSFRRASRPTSPAPISLASTLSFQSDTRFYI